ncbi:hypothetical protein PAPYR_5432 [Paratrimastix pyriformis]|uniref:Uncharacterized protein n=1 Tax=Paratrimastix pyriformis TaxID=342808 RepID=A0ABQ8UMI1_9EUKA|nr:hypothetical protein PAPYR_5432 [Paratrimastix pyriformis]
MQKHAGWYHRRPVRPSYQTPGATGLEAKFPLPASPAAAVAIPRPPRTRPAHHPAGPSGKPFVMDQLLGWYSKLQATATSMPVFRRRARCYPEIPTVEKRSSPPDVQMAGSLPP